MILVAGEALVDLLIDPAERVLARPGGGAFNAGRTIGRLGVPVTFLGRISADRFGRQLQAGLTQDGVSLACPEPVEAPTTLALAELDADGQARYRFYLTGTSAAILTEGDTRGTVAMAPEIVYVASLGLVMEPIASTLEALVAALPSDVLVMVDPNCRPTAIGDQAAYRERLARILGRADVVRVSVEDLAFVAPGTDPLEAAAEILDLGPAVCLVTAGPADAIALSPRGQVRVPVPPARVVDTVGAGDAFGGAFLAWWWRSGLGRGDLVDVTALRDGLSAAVVVAAATCERAGGSPPTLAELESRGVAWPGSGAPPADRGASPLGNA